MGLLLMGLGGIAGLASFICSIIILIAAFQDEVWKGILGFFCGFYLLYYMFAEFQHEKKGLIVGGAVGGWLVSMVFYLVGAGMAASAL